MIRVWGLGVSGSLWRIELPCKLFFRQTQNCQVALPKEGAPTTSSNDCSIASKAVRLTAAGRFAAASHMGIMKTRMETTTVYCRYIGIVRMKMETTVVHQLSKGFTKTRADVMVRCGEQQRQSASLPSTGHHASCTDKAPEDVRPWN